MERQLLATILITFLFVSCQQIEVTQSPAPVIEKSNLERKLNSENNLKQFQYSNIWEYILLNNKSNDDYVINNQILFYMNNHLQDIDQFTAYLNDSYYFIFFVIEELEKANLPIELALLPYIESNYDPFSISPSGAVGMWQFMPRTGRYYELDKSWWNEDRHDPFKSTEAAVEYLKYLYERFDGDIYNTIAAYNAGPSLLEKRINQNKRRGLPTDFWLLNVPKQTGDYVPKYIALKELIFNSEKYGVVLPEIPYEPVVKKITVPGQVEVLTLSQYLKMKPELLYKLNAGYTKWASAPADNSIFFIPIEKYEKFKDTDNPFNESNQINWISHIVERGETLWSIASKYDTEVKIIKEINYLKNDLLSIGETLLVPLGKTKKNNFIPYEMHIVSEGDTLWGLSKLYGINTRDLAKMNSLNVDDYLQLGQQLTIGNKNIHRNIESKKRTILYSVKQGDNLYKISELFDVTVESIEDVNEFNNPTLMPGQIIKVAIRAF